MPLGAAPNRQRRAPIPAPADRPVLDVREEVPEPSVLEGLRDPFDLLVELDAFLVESRDSPAVGEVSLLKGKLLFSYIDRNEGQKMLKDLRQRYRADAYITSEIDRTLNVR
jgi:hypothetical protein